MDFKKTLDTKSAVERGFTYTVLDFDGVETDAKISVIGIGSRAFTLAYQPLETAMTKAKARGKELDPEVYEDLWCTVLAKCTTGWENVEDDGKPLAFSVENAKQLYLNYPPAAKQIGDAIMNVKAMLQGN